MDALFTNEEMAKCIYASSTVKPGLPPEKIQLLKGTQVVHVLLHSFVYSGTSLNGHIHPIQQIQARTCALHVAVLSQRLYAKIIA